MKKILFICFLFVNSLAFSQSEMCDVFTGPQFSSSKLDSILFDKINKYRVSKRLKKLVFDTYAVKASNHHSKYQYNKCDVTHGEDTLKRPGDRYKYYGGNTTNVAEVVVGSVCYVKEGDPLYLEKIADSILNMWKKSPPHNAALLDKTATCGGGSSVYKFTIQIRPKKTYLSFSTFIIL